VLLAVDADVVLLAIQRVRTPWTKPAEGLATVQRAKPAAAVAAPDGLLGQAMSWLARWQPTGWGTGASASAWPRPAEFVLVMLIARRSPSGGHLIGHARRGAFMAVTRGVGRALPTSLFLFFAFRLTLATCHARSDSGRRDQRLVFLAVPPLLNEHRRAVRASTPIRSRPAGGIGMAERHVCSASKLQWLPLMFDPSGPSPPRPPTIRWREGDPGAVFGWGAREFDRGGFARLRLPPAPVGRDTCRGLAVVIDAPLDCSAGPGHAEASGIGLPLPVVSGPTDERRRSGKGQLSGWRPECWSCGGGDGLSSILQIRSFMFLPDLCATA